MSAAVTMSGEDNRGIITLL